MILVASGLAPAAAQAVEPETARSLAEQLEVRNENSSVAYVRDAFGGWIDADGDKCNTRYEVLRRDSMSTPEVTEDCKIFGGTWQSQYDDHIAHAPSEIEIDHVVALAEAWRSGAWAWSSAEQIAFGNDLGVPYALVPSSTAANQQKADKDPSRWVPANPDLVCDYVTDWVRIKYRWALTVDPMEQAAILGYLDGDCGDRTVELPEVMRTELPSAPEGPAGPEAGEPGATAVIEEPVVPKEPEVGTVIAPFGSGETRLQGTDRYRTAVSVAAKFAPKVPALFVATGADFPDALAASAAAANLGAPLLLTPASSVPSHVLSEAKRLKPAKIIVVGGTSVVSNKALQQLKAVAPTSRVAGADRYATGLKIVASSFRKSDFAVIATGRTFPDALAATSVAGLNSAPVILVDGTKKSVPGSVVSELKRLGVKNVMIAGGTGVVSNGIRDQLRNKGFSVDRRGGADRYETAALINNKWFTSGSSSHYFLSTGEAFPDALAAAALAGQIDAPLYVTRSKCMPTPVSNSIKSLGAKNRVVLGGTGAVSAAAAKGTVCAASTPKPPATSTPKPPVPVTSVKPRSDWSCPAGYPIKGNINSRKEKIYHVPGGQFYERTNPEFCFSSESAAVRAGYRASLR